MMKAMKAALEFLPEEDGSHRFAVHQIRGLVLVGLDDPNAADMSVSKAETFAEESETYKAQLWWLRAQIAVCRRDYSRAIQLYSQTIQEFVEAPGDAALAGAELCRTYLQAERFAEAVVQASNLATLAIPRSQNRIVAAAILDLYRSATAGALTIKVAKRAVKRIQWGLKRRATSNARPGA